MLLDTVKPFAYYKSSLYIMDNVIMLGDRGVIPKVIRPRVLHLPNAAHQGIDRMKTMTADVVYWHGIVGDISMQREACIACHKMASQTPPLHPMTPQNQSFRFNTYVRSISVMGERNTVWWSTGILTGPGYLQQIKGLEVSLTASVPCSLLLVFVKRW